MSIPSPRNAKPASAFALMATGLIGTMTLLGSYRFLIKPYLDARQRKKAEEYANYIYDKQQSGAEQSS